MKNILVTGASSGIGKATAQALINRGDMVWTLQRTEPALEGSYMTNLCDFKEQDEVDDFLAGVEATITHRASGFQFDGVVLCAGVNPRELDQWDEVVMGDVVGVNALSQMHLLEGLEELGALSPGIPIVAVSSFLAREGSAKMPAYSLSKAILEHWLRCFEAKPRETVGPIVRTLYPGRVNTPQNPKRELPASDTVQFREPADVAPYVLCLLEPAGPLMDLRHLDIGEYPCGQ